MPGVPSIRSRKLFEVVDRHAELSRHGACSSHGEQDVLRRWQVRKRSVQDSPAAMRPEQMHVPHPEGRREPNDPCERLHIVTDDRRRQRRLQSGGDRGLNTGHDPREAPRAANRVVDLFSWAVEAHLDPQSGGWELGTRNWGFTRRPSRPRGPSRRAWSAAHL